MSNEGTDRGDDAVMKPGKLGLDLEMSHVDMRDGDRKYETRPGVLESCDISKKPSSHAAFDASHRVQVCRKVVDIAPDMATAPRRKVLNDVVNKVADTSVCCPPVPSTSPRSLSGLALLHADVSAKCAAFLRDTSALASPEISPESAGVSRGAQRLLDDDLHSG
nr:hypothetical protein CFP56_76884 [Quercus suber]